jgi:hypothetical protein
LKFSREAAQAFFQELKKSCNSLSINGVSSIEFFEEMYKADSEKSFFTKLCISKNGESFEGWDHLVTWLHNHQSLKEMTFAGFIFEKGSLDYLLPALITIPELKKITFDESRFSNFKEFIAGLKEVISKKQLDHLKLRNLNLSDIDIIELGNALKISDKSNSEAGSNVLQILDLSENENITIEGALKFLQLSIPVKELVLRASYINELTLCLALPNLKLNPNLHAIHIDSLQLFEKDVIPSIADGKAPTTFLTVKVEDAHTSCDKFDQLKSYLLSKGIYLEASDMSYDDSDGEYEAELSDNNQEIGSLFNEKEPEFIDFDSLFKGMKSSAYNLETLQKIAAFKNDQFREKLFIQFLRGKFKTFDVKGDGNCYFYCLAFLVNNESKKFDYDSLFALSKEFRKESAKTIEEDLVEIEKTVETPEGTKIEKVWVNPYESFLDTDQFADIKSYCRYMEQDKKWAGQFELSATPKYLNKKFPNDFFILHIYDLQSFKDKGINHLKFEAGDMKTLPELTYQDGNPEGKNVRHIHILRQNFPGHYLPIIPRS